MDVAINPLLDVKDERESSNSLEKNSVTEESLTDSLNTDVKCE
jgi:hypothetical protein